MAKADKDKNSRFQGDSYASKTVWVTDINEAVAVQFHDVVMDAYEENPAKPIIIHINSYGGEVDALFSMLDTMDSIRAGDPRFKFITVCKGKAQSAGAVLLSYGDYRFATPNSRIMIHQVLSATYGGQADNEVEFKETTRLNTVLLNILKKRCKLKISMTEFRELLSHNLYLTPTEAKQFGIVDIIGYPKIIEKAVYEVVVLNTEDPNKGKKNETRRSNKNTTKSKSKA